MAGGAALFSSILFAVIVTVSATLASGASPRRALPAEVTSEPELAILGQRAEPMRAAIAQLRDLGRGDAELLAVVEARVSALDAALEAHQRTVAMLKTQLSLGGDATVLETLNQTSWKRVGREASALRRLHLSEVAALAARDVSGGHASEAEARQVTRRELRQPDWR